MAREHVFDALGILERTKLNLGLRPARPSRRQQLGAGHGENHLDPGGWHGVMWDMDLFLGPQLSDPAEGPDGEVPRQFGLAQLAYIP